MRILARFVILFLGMFAVEAFAQTSDYVARFRHTSAQIETSARIEKSCMLISPTGEFHLERALANIEDNKKPKVFTGSLTPEQMNSLRQLLSSPQVINFKEPGRPNRTLTRDADIFAAQIPRGWKTQSIYFVEDDYHSKWPPGLKDLEKWFLKVTGQKIAENTLKEPNNCASF
jgi:hypothetical protein